jgi:hypothetical protein
MLTISANTRLFFCQIQDDELIGIVCGFGAKNAFHYSITNKVQSEDVQKVLDILPRKQACFKRISN